MNKFMKTLVDIMVATLPTVLAILLVVTIWCVSMSNAQDRFDEYERQIDSLKLESSKPNYEPVQFYDIALPIDLQAYTYAMCCYYEIPDYYELALAVMQCESGFDSTSISSTGDYGLMQINNSNFEWLESNLGLYDMLDPLQNIQAGVYILSNALKEYGAINMALMCYNMGSTKAKELWSEGIYSTEYTEKVIEVYIEYIY